jgi:hypothetical protein
MDRNEFFEKYKFDLPYDKEWSDICDRCRGGERCNIVAMCYGKPIVSSKCPFVAELAILGVIVIEQTDYADIMKWVMDEDMGCRSYPPRKQ